MESSAYQRLSMFREGTMAAGPPDRLKSQARQTTYEVLGPMDRSEDRTVPDRKRFNYRPTILHTTSLLAFFVITLALIAVVEYAVRYQIRHGLDDPTTSAAPTSHARRQFAHELHLLVPRNASTVDSSSAIATATATSSSADSDTTSIAVGTAAPTEYLVTDTTVSTSAIATTTSASQAYINTDTTVTVSSSSPTFEPTADQSDYLNTGTTATISTSPVVVGTAAPDNYVVTGTTVTISSTTASVIANTLLAKPNDYVPTGTTVSISSGIVTSAAESAILSDYVSTQVTVTVGSSSRTTPTGSQQSNVVTGPSTKQSAYVTTESSAVVVQVPVSTSTLAPSTIVLLSTQTSVRSGSVILQTHTTVSSVPAYTSSFTVLSTSTSISGSHTIVQVYTTISTTTGSASAVTIVSTDSTTAATQTLLQTLTSTSVRAASATLQYSASTSYTAVVATITPAAAAQSTVPASSDYNTNANFGAKGYTLIEHWTAGDTFMSTYLAVLVAVVYRVLWTILYNNFTLIEPFRQLSHSSGALAEHALFSFYQSQSVMLGPFPALMKRRWAMALTMSTYLLACLLPALASEAVFVNTNWGCKNQIPGEPKNPCPAKIEVNITVARMIEGLLCFAAVVLLILTAVLFLSKTGLPANPSAMATTATLMRHPAVLEDLNEAPVNAKAHDVQRAMAGKRYQLGYYKSASGEIGYGIKPMNGGELAVAPRQVMSSTSHQYTPVEGSSGWFSDDKSSIAHRFRFMDFLLAIVVIGTLGVTVAYYVDGQNDSFNRFFNSDSFGPRFILTGAGTILAELWKSVEQSEVVMAPYKRLHNAPTPAHTTLLFTPSNTPLLSTLTTLANRYFFVTSITCVTLAAEALNIVISGIPYATGQTWYQMLVSVYITIGVLSIMTIVSILVILSRRTEPRIPRKPDTLASVMGYMCGSRMLEDFEGLEFVDERSRDGQIRQLGKRYEFREMMRGDGKVAWVVDEVVDERKMAM